MARVTLRPQAEADILEIWEYIAGDNISAADRWVDELDEKMALWATQPLMGRVRYELVPGIRSLPFGRYVAFFVSLPDGIDTVRVLHSSRDLEMVFTQ